MAAVPVCRENTLRESQHIVRLHAWEALRFAVSPNNFLPRKNLRIQFGFMGKKLKIHSVHESAEE